MNPPSRALRLGVAAVAVSAALVATAGPAAADSTPPSTGSSSLSAQIAWNAAYPFMQILAKIFDIGCAVGSNACVGTPSPG
ncbi:hypothetical protein LTV02_01590 [Nocardia yamanashiensis]|uniref:hypothetical protein n=1 Tax=Nocardia yamanashiensis TaxID=209247 RepID=UPI001E327063|nr:hypothetical protein [Nocardia yamanashiensis]UGT42150.1 hypothetical protein LTV02_01590 [Nocardia yamanashiensis]